MGSYGGFKYAAAVVVAALLLASASIWAPPRISYHRESMTTITTNVVLGRGSNITLTPIPTPTMSSPRAAPNVSKGVMPPSPMTHYPRFALLASLVKELGAILNSIVAALLAFVNALARLFSINPSATSPNQPSSAAKHLDNPYLAVLATLATAVVAATVLRLTLLKRRKIRLPLRQGFRGLGKAPPSRPSSPFEGGFVGDPLVELVRLLARRAGDELGVNSDALTHRDLMRVCSELRSVSEIASPSEVAEVLHAYELRRFAGAGIKDSLISMAEGILRRLGGER